MKNSEMMKNENQNSDRQYLADQQENAVRGKNYEHYSTRINGRTYVLFIKRANSEEEKNLMPKNPLVFLLFFIFSLLPLPSSLASNFVDPCLSSDQMEMAMTHPDGSLHFVQARSGLTLRAEPSMQAPVLTVLEYGSQVCPLEFHGEVFQIGYVSGRWARVESDGMYGYVFDGFISSLPVPRFHSELYWITDVVERYALDHFQIKNRDTIQYGNEFDLSHVVQYRFGFENEIFLTKNVGDRDVRLRLEIPGIRMMDAYHWLSGIMVVADHPEDPATWLIFKKNREGSLYEISNRGGDEVIIRQTDDGHVVIDVRASMGC